MDIPVGRIVVGNRLRLGRVGASLPRLHLGSVLGVALRDRMRADPDGDFEQAEVVTVLRMGRLWLPLDGSTPNERTKPRVDVSGPTAGMLTFASANSVSVDGIEILPTVFRVPGMAYCEIRLG